MSEAVALIVLAASLAAAVARPRWAPEWAVAAVGAVLLVAIGVLSFKGARGALSALGPTVGFLASLLVLADGCRRAGLFDAMGAWMAHGARGRPRRLLVMVFLAAALTTSVLSLDATIVLLTPIVFTTAARLPTNPGRTSTHARTWRTRRRCCCRSRTSQTCSRSGQAACLSPGSGR